MDFDPHDEPAALRRDFLNSAFPSHEANRRVGVRNPSKVISPGIGFEIEAGQRLRDLFLQFSYQAPAMRIRQNLGALISVDLRLAPFESMFFMHLRIQSECLNDGIGL